MTLNIEEIVLRKSRSNYRSNHLDPFDWAGGSLFLTKRRLIFKPHFFNLRKEEESIPLDNIISIEAKNSDFISSKITIFLANDFIEEFRVPQRKNWVEDIKKAVKKAKKDGGEEWDINERIDFTIPKKSFRWFAKVAIQALLYAICVSVLIFVILTFIS